MTTNFEDRREAFENKFAHDQEVNFKIKVKVLKLAAKWVYNSLGNSSALDAKNEEEYIANVKNIAIVKDGDKKVIEKLMADIKELNSPITEEELLKQINIFYDEVRKEYL